MPSSKEKRAQRHQSQLKQQTGRFANRTKVTEQVAGVGYRETQLIGGRKFYTPLSNDPNQVFGGSGDTTINAFGFGEGSAVTSHASLTGLDSDNHPQYLLVDGQRNMAGNLTVGTDGVGYDVTFYSATAGDSFVWDASEEKLTITGTNGQTALNVSDGNVVIANTLTTTNFGATTLSGKLTAGSEEIEGSAFDINGGTIDAITSLTVANDVDIGNYKLTSKALEASDLSTSGGIIFAGSNGLLTTDSDITFATDTLTVTKIGAYTLTGKLTAGSSEIEGTAFDIDGGDVSAITISGDLTWSSDQTGVSSLTLANSKNIDLTTGNITFTPTANDTLIISSTTHGASTIATTDASGTNASLTLDIDGDIILDPHTGDVKLLKAGSWYGAKLIPKDDNTFTIHSGDGGDEGTLTFRSEGGSVLMSAYDSSGPTETTRFRFLLDSTPELDVTGDFKIDGSGDITLDPAGGNVFLRDGNNNIFDFNVANPTLIIYDDVDQNDYFQIKVSANGATTFKTVDNYMADADLTFDIDGDIILDASDNDIFFKDDGSERFRMDLDSTPTLAVTGAFDLDASSTVTIDATSTFFVKTNSNNVIEANTSGNIYFHNYPQDRNVNNYKLNTLSDKYHFTTGQADFKQNFTILAYYEERTTTSEYEAYPSG